MQRDETCAAGTVEALHSTGAPIGSSLPESLVPGESGKEYEMTLYLKPHTAEWFKVLETVNPLQAAHTKHILSLTGSDAVCSICGDESNRDYKLVNEEAAHSAVSTMRLCDDCLDIRRSMHNENFVLVAS